MAGALNSFEITGLLLGFSCWVKFHPDLGNAQADYLDDVLYERMLNDRWPVVLSLAKWGADRSTFDASSRTTLTMNMWLALKRLGRFGECREAVQGYDCSALKPVFAAARAALLDDSDESFMIVESSDAAGFDERAWDEWPIVTEMRSDPRMDVLKQRYIEASKQSGRDIGDTTAADGLPENESHGDGRNPAV